MRMVTTLICWLFTIALWTPQRCTPNDHMEWLAHSFQELETIHVGMKREDLLKILKPEAGFFSSTRSKGIYVYRGSPYIKLDVEFASESGDQQGPESANDVVTSVSRPYLAQPVYD